ncbi:hypothetical protein AALB51_02930 [Lachnospiraceae bacterium 62-26]|jgi:hypothetical protein|nr:hypothetical protein IMSAGC020_01082 [Lachnospiraceae bacterium]
MQMVKFVIGRIYYIQDTIKEIKEEANSDGKLEYVIYGTEAQAKILLDGAGYH